MRLRRLAGTASTRPKFTQAAAAANASAKDLLVFHVEGGRCGKGGASYCGVPSYPIRHAVSRRFAPKHVELGVGATRNEVVAAYATWEHEHGIRRLVPGHEYSRLLQRARYCLVTEGFAPLSPRLGEAIRFGCVPVLLSPSLRPPFASTLDWSQFSISHDPSRLDELFGTLRDANYELLHANLVRVRPLFAWCLATRDVCDERRRHQHVLDALDLAVYEMSQRHRRDEPEMSRRVAEPARVRLAEMSGRVAASGEVLGLASPDGGPLAMRTRIRYACSEDATSSCSYDVGPTRWNCSIIHKSACACRRV